MDTRLLKILDEEVAKEKERKKPRISGKVIEKKITKSDNILFIVENPKREKNGVKMKINDDIYFLPDDGSLVDMNEGFAIRMDQLDSTSLSFLFGTKKE